MSAEPAATSAITTPARPSAGAAVAACVVIALAFVRGLHAGPLQAADIAVVALIAVAAGSFFRGGQALPGSLLFVALPALAGLSLMHSPSLGPGVADALKVVAFLMAGPILFALASRQVISKAIAAGTVITLLVGIVQYLLKRDPPGVCGLLENRSLYGAALAIGAPFVLAELFSIRGAVGKALALLFVAAASVTILSAPLLIIFAAVVLLFSWRSGRVPLIACTVGLAVTFLIGATRHLPLDNAAALTESVSMYDENGNTRRFALETIAAARAVADRPVIGHGPGSYQSIVSSARYRDNLPPAAENRVEPGTNAGIIVAAVEMGLPLAMIIAALLVSLGVRASRANDGDAVARAASCSAFALAAALFFTSVLIGGAGWLAAAVLGLCISSQALPSRAMSAGPWLLTRGAAIALPLLAGVLLNIGGGRAPLLVAYGEQPAADLSGAGAETIVLEAEDAGIVVAPMRAKPRSDATAGGCIGVDEGAGKPPVVEGSALYPVEVKHHGRYRLWIRAWWSDGCANSIMASLNHQPAHMLGQDGTYSSWHWVSGPVTELKAGSHVVTLLHREDNVEVDQILLTSDDGFEPSGTIAATQRPKAKGASEIAVAPTPTAPETKQPAYVAVNTPEPAPAPPPKTIETPTKTEPAVPPPAPASVATRMVTLPKPNAQPIVAPEGKGFLAGVVGTYRDGFEGHLATLGVPYVRLHDDEVENIESLKDIDVLFISEPHCNAAAFYRTLYAYLKSGKRAVVEFLPEEYSAADDPDDIFFVKKAPRERRFQHSTLIPDGSKFFKGITDNVPYADDVTCNWMPLTSDLPGVKIYGGQSVFGAGKKISGALCVREMGEGKLYYLGTSAGFAAMWRGRKLDPFLVNIISDAVGDKCRPPFAELQFAQQRALSVNQSDDFMRTPGQKGGWNRQQGSFILTGQEKDQRTAFSVEATDTSFAVIGNDAWSDYRISAAVLLRKGEAGVWQYLADGSRLCLRLKEVGSGVTLSIRTGDAEKVLAEAAVPMYRDGWRRLSLFRRNGVTHGFVDGERVISTPDAPAAKGKCGLCTIDGDAYFDDFSAIDASALTPLRDTAPGEEGSERCTVRFFQRCSEKLSIYSPTWQLRPSGIDQHYLQCMLPLFNGGELQIDGGAGIPIAPASSLGFVKLPGEGLPKIDIAVHTPYVRDYHFGGRVTDWYVGSGDWNMVNRWSCNPEYEWYGGRSNNDAVLWHKHETSGNVAMEVMMAPRADKQFMEERGNNLNLVVHGNGKDLSAGYGFVVLGSGRGYEIQKNGKAIASRKLNGIGEHMSLHHPWFSVVAVVSGKHLSFYFDRRLVLECDDDEPLTKGKAGIWTRNNKISVARATVSFSDELSEPAVQDGK